MASKRKTPGGDALRVVLYVRISSDPGGLEKGVDRQEKDCRALAAALGWQVVRVFRKDDTSAYKQKTVTLATGERVRRVIRPQFREMLALLARRGADAMIAYDLDRAVRDPRDLEDLIDTKVQCRNFLRRYMPTNILLDLIRTRRGLKWGIPSMLLAGPYLLAASISNNLISDGAPGWVNLVVVLCIWNALKFLIMGPVSVILILRVRIHEAAERSRVRRRGEAMRSQRYGTVGA